MTNPHECTDTQCLGDCGLGKVAKKESVPSWVDEKALEIARKFVSDPQKRAALQVEIVAVMQTASWRYIPNEAVHSGSRR